MQLRSTRQVPNRILQVSLFLLQQSQAKPGSRLIRIETYCAVEVLARRRVLAQRSLCCTKIGIGLSQQTSIGSQRNNRLILCDGIVQPAMRLEINPEIVMTHGIARIDLCRRLKMREGNIGLAF